MASIRDNEDYYGILGVPYTATPEEIKISYRKLAMARHPDKNPNNPDATASFQRLAAAYDILRDQGKRNAYDIKCRRASDIQQTKHATSAKESTERRREKAAEYSAKEDKERLAELAGERRTCEESIIELKRKQRENREYLKSVQDEDDKARQQEARSSWWSFLTSSFFGKPEEQEEQRIKKEADRIRRFVRRHNIESEIEREEAALQRREKARQDAVGKMGAIKKKLEAAARAQSMEEEQLRNNEEEKKPTEEERTRQRWAEWTKRQEAARRAGEPARRQTQDEAGAARMTQERQEWFRSIWVSPNVGSTTSYYRANCGHGKFWPRITGPHICENCQTTQRHFAFQCPGCQKVACANCRQILRDQAWGN